MRFDVAAGQVVARLRAAGLAAAVDPRDLDPPAVWVQLADVDLSRFKAGQYLATWNLTLIAPDSGTSQALATLGRLSADLVDAFPTIRTGQALGVILPGGPDPMPAMQYTVQLVCTDDDTPPPPNGD
jgi:hypothetical protein